MPVAPFSALPGPGPAPVPPAIPGGPPATTAPKPPTMGSGFNIGNQIRDHASRLAGSLGVPTTVSDYAAGVGRASQPGAPGSVPPLQAMGVVGPDGVGGQLARFAHSGLGNNPAMFAGLAGAAMNATGTSGLLGTPAGLPLMAAGYGLLGGGDRAEAAINYLGPLGQRLGMVPKGIPLSPPAPTPPTAPAPRPAAPQPLPAAPAAAPVTPTPQSAVPISPPLSPAPPPVPGPTAAVPEPPSLAVDASTLHGSAVDAGRDAAHSVLGAGRDVADTITGALPPGIGGRLGSLVDRGHSLAGDAVNTIADANHAVGQFAGNAADRVGDFASGVGNRIGNWFR